MKKFIAKNGFNLAILAAGLAFWFYVSVVK